MPHNCCTRGLISYKLHESVAIINDLQALILWAIKETSKLMQQSYITDKTRLK